MRGLTIAVLLSFAGTSNAAVIVVTSLADTVNQNGSVTLREAIMAANTDTSVDGSVAGQGADTIRFAPGLNGTVTISTESSVKAFGPTAYVISSDITIDSTANGNAVELRVAGPARLRHFGVLGDASLTLRGLTLSGGISLGGRGGNANSTRGGGGAGMGGSIFNRGTLVLDGCVFSGNTAQGGAAGGQISGPYGAGGGGSIGGDGGSDTATGNNGAGAGVAGNGGNSGDTPPGLGGANESGARAARGAPGTLGGGGGADMGGVAGNGLAPSSAGLGGGGGGSRNGIAGHGGFGAGGGSTAFGTGGNGGFGGGKGTGTTATDGFGAQNGTGAGMGGAIFNHGGDVSITDCAFIGNAATTRGYGGAVFTRNGLVSIQESSAVDNTANVGGTDFFAVGDAAPADLLVLDIVNAGVGFAEINGGTVRLAAKDDEYSMVDSTVLVVSAAEGVLANDGMVAIHPGVTVQDGLQTTQQGGMVQIHADGAFEYTAPQGYIGLDGFSYVQLDGSNVLGSADVAVDVINVENAPPVLTVPGCQLVDEMGEVTLSTVNGNQVSVFDEDSAAGMLTAILLLESGRVSLATTDGITVIAGADGSSLVVFSATRANINRALDGMTLALLGAPSGELEIVVTDNGNTGAGPQGVASATVGLESEYIFADGFENPADSPATCKAPDRD